MTELMMFYVAIEIGKQQKDDSNDNNYRFIQPYLYLAFLF